LKKREETRKLLEEEKQKRLEKFPELAQPKPEGPSKLTDEEKRKIEWAREKKQDQEEKERLRRELEEDKKRRAEKTKSPEELAEEARKQAKVTRELAELRRQRLGLNPSAPTTSTPSDTMDTSPVRASECIAFASCGLFCWASRSNLLRRKNRSQLRLFPRHSRVTKTYRNKSMLNT